jgi:ABC-2 type transport system ATP-binding protein
MNVSPPATVRASGLRKRFGATVALDDVDLTVGPGVTGLLGPNGAGKTTLLRILATVLAPDAGSVESLGVDSSTHAGRLEVRRRLGYVPQEPGFHRSFTAFEFVDYVAILKEWADRRARHDETRRVLSLVGLDPVMHKRIRDLSGGMRRRLAIAQALIGRPDLLVLDEPTAGLDPVNASAVRRLINDIKTKAKATLIVSSHNMAEIQELCGAVAILHNGKLVEHRSVAELTEAKGNVRMTFGRKLESPEVEKIRALPGVGEVDVDTQNEYTIELKLAAGQTADQLIGALVSELAKSGLVPRSVKEGASLEEKFLEATGHSNQAR